MYFEKPAQVNAGMMRVWWNTEQTVRYYYVTTIEDAMKVLSVLTTREMDDDSIEFNASGLEQYDGQEWTEYYDDDGRDIQEMMAEE